MARNNPFEGGPDFVQSLCNALERKESTFTRPPSSGGTQVSIRFREDRLAILNSISERSGWNRNQVVDALTDVGLLLLFTKLSDTTEKKIREDLAADILKSRQ
jgi:hypothetical protein